jgi:large repetitive protein
MLRLRGLLAGAALLVLLGPETARAQRGIDVQMFKPAMDAYGIFTVERADSSHQWDFGFKVYANYAGNPLRLSMFDATAPTMPSVQNLMERQIGLNFGAHLGLTNWLQLMIDFPISAQSYTSAYGDYGDASKFPISRTGFYEPGPFTNIPPPDAAAGDARIGLKWKFFRKGLFGMALNTVVTIPFGDDAAFLGDTGFTFRPNLIADFTRGPITVALNVGAIVRETTEILDPHEVALKLANPRMLLHVGHELTFGVGFAYRFVHWVGLGAEAYGFIPLTSPAITAPNVAPATDYSLGVLGGLQFFPTRDLILALGAGAGVLTSAARHEDFRVFLGITWAPVVGGKGAVAVGGLDTDGDGIPDSQDLCPNEREDKDGFDDEDGCPDPDNDQDGIPDKSDKCPNESEDRDGFQDADGCPETDNDNDQIPDAQDKCPNDAEDRDGFQDDDGCPDADNDGDGIADAADKCPNEPETRNGVDDDDGCPDSGGQVVIVGGRIEIPDAIQFETGKATLAGRSEALLDRIADKMKSNPQVKRVRIEGHTDDVGSPKKNQELSQSRAESVRDYLIKKGIEGDRLQAVGYGNSRPIDKRKSGDARAKNRRVEFIIVEQ